MFVRRIDIQTPTILLLVTILMMSNRFHVSNNACCCDVSSIVCLSQHPVSCYSIVTSRAMADYVGEAFATSEEEANSPQVANAGFGHFVTSDEEEARPRQKRPCLEAKALANAAPGPALAKASGPTAVEIGSRKRPAAAKQAVLKRPAAYRPDVLAPANQSDLPLNSGAFAYARWVVDMKLTIEEKLNFSKLGNLVVGSLCTGMCTEALAFEALRRAMPETFPKVTIAFVCESNDAKRNLLSRLLPDTIVVGQMADLAEDTLTDTSGKQWDKPHVNWLIGGLSCKCLSKLNRYPQSVMGDGPTGVTVKGMLNYLDSLSFEKRPDVVTVEEVLDLLTKRSCEDEHRTAIQILCDQMDARGYTAKWQDLISTMFYLPHSRDRVWTNFRKRKDSSSDMLMLEAVAAMLQRSSSVIARLQTGGHYESLSAILDRLGDAAFRLPPAISSVPISEATATANLDFMDKYGLGAADMDRMQELDALLSEVLTARARRAVVLKLAQCAKQKGWRWDRDLLVATAGQSASYMTLRKDVFPNLVPSAPFVVIRAGKPRLASGLLCLAMQGLHGFEVEFMGLGDMPDDKQRDIAGNAFSANVCIANVVGVMLELLPQR
jgi:site-specific DNA-cytosine methylase